MILEVEEGVKGVNIALLFAGIDVSHSRGDRDRFESPRRCCYYFRFKSHLFQIGWVYGPTDGTSDSVWSLL